MFLYKKKDKVVFDNQDWIIIDYYFCEEGEENKYVLKHMESGIISEAFENEIQYHEDTQTDNY